MRNFLLILALVAMFAGCATTNTANNDKKPKDSTVVHETVNPVVTTKPPVAK